MDGMDNKALGQVFRKKYEEIVKCVTPDSIIDVLYSKKIISSDDSYNLCHVPDPRNRCRQMMLLLADSSHPEAFVWLYRALMDQETYSWIVKDIDEKVQQLLHMDNSLNGNFLS